MNLKGLSPKARALVEAVTDAAAEEKYEIIEVDEDGDTVSLTFSATLGFDEDVRDDEEDDD